jgi:hypothetical protein
MAAAGLTPYSHPHVRRYLAVGLRSDAVYLLQLLDPSEPAMLLAPGENRLGSDRPDLWQLLELGLVGTVQIERALRGRAAAHITRPGLLSHLSGGMTCGADQHLLAIAQ